MNKKPLLVDKRSLPNVMKYIVFSAYKTCDAEADNK